MHIYLFYFINWDGWRCWWTDFVPEAIHNPVAIKLLVSGLLTWLIMYVCFNIDTDFVFIFYMFRASHLSFKHLIDRGGCHA